MFLSAVIRNIETVLQTNALPVYKQSAIKKKISVIKSLPSEKATKNALMQFCAELYAVTEAMLSLDQQTNFSAKNIKKLFTKYKISTAKGAMNVDVLEYLSITEINAEFRQTYLLDGTMRSKIQTLKVNMAGLADYLINTGQANFFAPQEQRLSSREIQTEQQILFERLTQVEAAITLFDNKLTTLYECPVSQVYCTRFMPIITFKPLAHESLHEIQNIEYQLSGASLDKEVTYVIGEADEKSLRANIAIVYIYALRHINKFLLTQSKNKDMVLPEISEQKESIRQEFNNKLKQALKNLPELSIEKRIGHLLKSDTMMNFFPLISEKPAAAQIAKRDTSFKEIHITVISKNINLYDLPIIDGVKYTLINDNEILLLEAAFAQKILKTENLLKHVHRAFTETPKHLLLLPNTLLKVDLENFLQETENDKLNLQNEYKNFIQTLEDKPFSFEKNIKLVNINHRIQETIAFALLSLQQKISAVAETEENILTSKKELVLINKNIHNTAKMLRQFISYYPTAAYQGCKLSRDFKAYSDKLPSLSLTMEEIDINHTRLSQENWFQRKSQQPLIQIEAYINEARTNLRNATRYLTDNAPLLNDSNNFDIVEASLNAIASCYEKFSLIIKQIKDETNKEMQFFKNADIRRFGENPHRLLRHPSIAISTTIDIEEKKDCKTLTP